MGYSGQATFVDGAWGGPIRDGVPFLRIDVHDSDIAQVDYSPSGPGRGRLFLGHEPRNYFGDPEANDEVDTLAETDGLSGWVRQVLGTQVDSEQLLPFLAHPDGSAPDAVFVEGTVIALLTLIGLPLPPALAVGPVPGAGPTYRVTSESGDEDIDLSGDTLRRLFEGVEAGRSTFLVVESLADPSGETYAQVSRHDDGSYVVEHRDGSHRRHWGTLAPDMPAALALIEGWAAQAPGWSDGPTWERVRLRRSWSLGRR